MVLVLLSVFLALVIACVGDASPLNPRPVMRVHEQRDQAPPGFIAVGRAPADTLLRMRLGLKQRDADGLIKTLYRVSDPANADYGKHLSKEEVAAFLRPQPDTLAEVRAWLSSNGIVTSPISPAGDWLEFTVPVSTADALFDAEFTVFADGPSGARGIRTLRYSIPTALHPAVDVLLPGTSFWNPKQPGPPTIEEVKVFDSVDLKRQVDPSCNSFITPACLLALYGIPSPPAPASPTNGLAVSGYIQQYANKADLTQFLRRFRPDIANGTFSTQLLDGGINPQIRLLAGIEANLDMQYTKGIANGVDTTFISVGSQNRDGELEGFLDTVQSLTSQSPNQPKVLTTSYGFNEAQISINAARALCTAYAASSAQGTSIIFASGDGGVSGSQSAACTSFVTTFPSGCPFVTSVGATMNVNPETSANFSSGGFSNYFETPTYQSAAVTTYRAQIGSLYTGLYNVSGRAYPDVSAAGRNYVIAYNGLSAPSVSGFVTVSGTSASSPVFASVVAIINARRIALGLPPLGFLNPFLYANPGIFNDITTGSNPGCGTNGFPAKVGWDPVTGLGTPNFPAFAAAAGVP